MLIHRFVLAMAAVSLAAPALLHAQDNGVYQKRLAAASAAMYNESKDGLQGFHCKVTTDWQQLFSSVSGQPMGSDNPRLQAFLGIQMSISDKLSSGADFTWKNPDDMPKEVEASAMMLKQAFQQMLAGFFMSWNAYMTGSMADSEGMADAKFSMEGGLMHVKGGGEHMTVDEAFNDENVLVSAHVSTPDMDIMSRTSFVHHQKGLLVSSIASEVKMPATAPAVNSVMSATYMSVQGYRIPETVTVTQGQNKFVMKLSACEIDQPVSRTVEPLS